MHHLWVWTGRRHVLLLGFKSRWCVFDEEYFREKRCNEVFVWAIFMGTNYIWPGQVDSEESNSRQISGRCISLVHKCLHHLADTISSVRVTIPHLIWIGFSRWLCTAEGDESGAANHSALTTLGHCKAFLQGLQSHSSLMKSISYLQGSLPELKGEERQCSVVVEVAICRPNEEHLFSQ